MLKFVIFRGVGALGMRSKKSKKCIIIFVFTLLFSNLLLAKNFSLFDKRFDTLKKNAEAGDKRSQYKMGLAFLNGSDVKVSIKKALFWFTKSAKQNYVKSFHKLGIIYYENKDGGKNYTKGFRWLLKASNKEFGVSQYYLSLMYLQGRGVRKDIDRALYWAAKAKNNGVRYAEKLLLRIDEAVSKSGKSRRKILTKNKGKKKIKQANIKTNKKRRARKAIDKVLVGGWKQADTKPAQFLPSDINTCTIDADTIRCKSGRIKIQTKNYEAHFKIDTLITDFQKNRIFLVRYRYTYLYVLPDDPDDPEPKYFLPKIGANKSINNQRCKLVRRKLIRCHDDKGKKTEFKN